MIDRHIFATGMGVLTGAFGRQPLDAPTSIAYYDALSPLLATAQFEQAVKDVIAGERFWPSPAVILHAAGVAPNTRAALEAEGAKLFASLKRWLSAAGGPQRVRGEDCAELSRVTWRAISAVGGLAAIYDVSPERFPKLERDFAAHYAEAVAREREPSIAPKHAEPALPGEHHAPLPKLLMAS